MSSKKEFIKTLDEFGRERIRIKLSIDKGKLIDLFFQYESLISGKWKEIVRYDIAHGFFHRDFIYPSGKKKKTRIQISELRTAATFAEQDIRDKWDFYKAKYLKELKKKNNDK